MQLTLVGPPLSWRYSFLFLADFNSAFPLLFVSYSFVSLRFSPFCLISLRGISAQSIPLYVALARPLSLQSIILLSPPIPAFSLPLLSFSHYFHRARRDACLLNDCLLAFSRCFHFMMSSSVLMQIMLSYLMFSHYVLLFVHTHTSISTYTLSH